MIRKTLIEKLIILQRARKTGNITETCREFGISRISYYHIKKSVREHLLESRRGSSDDEGDDCESLIEDMVLDNPGLSTNEISKKLLAEHEIQLSHTSVHSRLKALNLNQSEQRWRRLEEQLKYTPSTGELSVRQRLFMQKHNPCFSAYHDDQSRPLERLNIDVIKFDGGRVCIAVDPATNYAFALALAKMDRAQIIDWLDAEVIARAASIKLPVKTVATSDLRLFDQNLDGESDYELFNDFLLKHDLQRVDLHAVKPVLDGSIRYCYDLLSPFLDGLSGGDFDQNGGSEQLAAWLEAYNQRHEYPYYPAYGLSPAAMVDYYLTHGKNWRGLKSLSASLRGYISPAQALGVRKSRALNSRQVNSVYSSVVSLLFK